jgi:hypothetical protein
MRVFENMALRTAFVPKREELNELWRNLHNEELHNLYSSQVIFRTTNSRKIRLVGECRTHGLEDKRIQNFGGKS